MQFIEITGSANHINQQKRLEVQGIEFVSAQFSSRKNQRGAVHRGHFKSLHVEIINIPTKAFTAVQFIETPFNSIVLKLQLNLKSDKKLQKVDSSIIISPVICKTSAL